MTKKDLFRLIIKIFGLYFVISTMLSTLPFYIETLTSLFDLNDHTDYSIYIWMIFNMLFLVFLFVFLIYKTDLIIKWLKLNKGFDEDRIDFQNFNIANILKLAVIVIGGLLLIHNIPIFLSNSWFAFKASVGSNINNDTTLQFGSLRDYINLGIAFINIVIGYFLVTNYNFVSKILKEK